MLKWTVDFHNEVNLRLNKKIFTYEDALQKWNGSQFCTENCDDEEEKLPIKEEEPVKKEDTAEEEIKNLGKMLIKNY